MSGARWKPIAGFPGYEVSECGLVRNADGTVLKPDFGSRGHLRVALWSPKGKRRLRWVHRLVIEAFAGPPIVRHIDDNPENNHVNNLRWGCRRENAADAARTGRRARGERVPQAKLTAERVVEIRAARSAGESCASIARRLGVSKAAVSAAARGDTWGHVA